MRVYVTEDFWALFPEARIGVVIARQISNATPRADVAEQLAVAITKAAERLGTLDIAKHPAIVPWRVAYRAFGAKPSDYRSSIENLLRSARSGRLRSINPLVDLYNLVSLKHWLPCGGEDLGAVRGDIRLTRAQGGEPFAPLGSTEVQPPFPGEVIYRDDEGVLCRAWNWREAERTKLTNETTNAILVIEALSALGDDAPRAACEALAALVQTKLGGTTRVEVLTRAQPDVEF
jgi:DNA/RNA-binding domain of Phe-tRNA-synthetase-like protein